MGFWAAFPSHFRPTLRIHYQFVKISHQIVDIVGEQVEQFTVQQQVEIGLQTATVLNNQQVTLSRIFLTRSLNRELNSGYFWGRNSATMFIA